MYARLFANRYGEGIHAADPLIGLGGSPDALDGKHFEVQAQGAHL